MQFEFHFGEEDRDTRSQIWRKGEKSVMRFY